MNIAQINRLAGEGTFPENDSIQKIIETHISWVLLGKKYAYKIKKPLTLSFLDFSTLARRKYYCGEELRLNRRLAPTTYLDVLPLSRFRNSFYVGDHKGSVIDYVVRMKKMNPSKEMHFLLGKDKVTRKDIRSIASLIYNFHQELSPIYPAFNLPGVKAAFNDILSVKDFLKKNSGKDCVRKVDAAVSQVNKFLTRNERRLKQRIQQGFVRDCHGDLHSKNIFLYKRPVVFDCVEFNEKFRHIDILDELAFLCMDLEAFGREDLSSYFLKSYGTGTDDNTADLFAYYKCYRANVRAKVGLMALMKRTAPYDKELNASLNYLDLMLSYASGL